jgi:hypothetical protein
VPNETEALWLLIAQKVVLRKEVAPKYTKLLVTKND